MTELMKRYEAETGMMAQEKVCDIDGWIETSEYVAWLEDQLRWRPVSEKPEKDGLYFVKDYDFYEMMKYKKGKWYEWDKMFGEWLVRSLSDEEYLPIPPAPEEESHD